MTGAFDLFPSFFLRALFCPFGRALPDERRALIQPSRARRTRRDVGRCGRGKTAKNPSGDAKVRHRRVKAALNSTVLRGAVPHADVRRANARICFAEKAVFSVGGGADGRVKLARVREGVSCLGCVFCVPTKPSADMSCASAREYAHARGAIFFLARVSPLPPAEGSRFGREIGMARVDTFGE